MYAWEMLMELVSGISHHSLSIVITEKVFMKFKIKKSYEMISYILVGMTLVSA
jgi:hypothetical protein